MFCGLLVILWSWIDQRQMRTWRGKGTDKETARLLQSPNKQTFSVTGEQDRFP